MLKIVVKDKNDYIDVRVKGRKVTGIEYLAILDRVFDTLINDCDLSSKGIMTMLKDFKKCVRKDD